MATETTEVATRRFCTCPAGKDGDLESASAQHSGSGGENRTGFGAVGGLSPRERGRPTSGRAPLADGIGTSQIGVRRRSESTMAVVY